MILGEPRPMRDVLRRLGTCQTFTGERFLDVLAATREGHHLLAGVPVKLPASVSSGDLDFISELLDLAGRFRAIDRSGEGLSAIDLNRIEAAPLAVRTASHVGDDDVSVKVRVGTVAVINSAGR